MSDQNIQILQRALEREKLARKEAEKILEKKSLELYEKTEELASINSNLSQVINEQTIEFNDIFDNIIDSYILMDLHGNVLKMNNPAKEFFGYDIEKDKFNVTDIIFEEDMQYAYQSFYQLIEVGHFENYQARIYTKSNEVKWVEINSRTISNGKTEPRFAHGIVRDITEQKRQQEAFEAQKKQLDTIVDNSSVGIVLTVQGRVVKSNAAFQRFVGYSEEEIANMAVMDVSLEFDKKETLKNLGQLISGEVDYFTMNKQYLTKEGRIVWGRTKVSVVRDKKRAIQYEVSIIEDITDELKKSALLESINALTASLLEKNELVEIAWEITRSTIGLLGFEDCIIYLVDNDGKNLKQVAAYGDKLVGDETIVNEITIPIGEGIVGTVAKTGKSEIISDTRKDSRYIVDDKIRLSEIAVPIKTNDEIIGVIDSEHSSKDFFTQDHLETLTTIASLVSTKLKYALSLRQKEKAEREKEQLLKDLQKSNKELNDFAHVVSHDLKSPLRGMNALVNWIKEDVLEFANDDMNQNFDHLLRRIDRMDLMINGILDYASIDKLEQESKKVDLNILVQDVMDGIHIPNHFTIEINNKLPIVQGHSYKFMQLFQNLISNAIKYCDKNKGLIKVDCVNRLDSWEFSVKDNGMGIEKKYQEKVFQIFQVLQESEESTGVGLSIVKKIIDFYHGRIWLESEPNVGTTFYFTIPKYHGKT